jgi:hypothetical protein
MSDYEQQKIDICYQENDEELDYLDYLMEEKDE